MLLYSLLSRPAQSINLLLLQQEYAIVGFNADTLEYNGISFSVLDVGGSQRQGEVPSLIGIILAFRMYVHYYHLLWNSDHLSLFWFAAPPALAKALPLWCPGRDIRHRQQRPGVDSSSTRSAEHDSKRGRY